MKKRIEITLKQAEKFNEMRRVLLMIAGIDKARSYMTPDQIRRNTGRNTGLDYDEELEMAYENMQGEARAAASGVRSIEIPPTETEIIHKTLGPHSL